MEKFSSTGSSPRAADVVESEDYHNGVALFGLDADFSWEPEDVAGRLEESSRAISLKLGKRAYFEDASLADPQLVELSKKRRECDQRLQQQVYCQVEGCDIELSAAKEYYRKHRVCEEHTKCPRVIVAGQERRFCQQCSRFHELMEFDENKRSCRKRLSDHNARRRKSELDIISFCSSIFTLSTYDDHKDGAHEISFLSDNTPNRNIRPGASAAWGYLHDSRLPRTVSWPLMKNAEAHVEQLRVPNRQLSTDRSALYNEVERTLPLKGGTVGVLNQISAAVSSACKLRGLDLPVILSLVSANPWPSSHPGESASPFRSDATTSITTDQSFLHTTNLISDAQNWQNHGSSVSFLSKCNALLSDAEN